MYMFDNYKTFYRVTTVDILSLSVYIPASSYRYLIYVLLSAYNYIIINSVLNVYIFLIGDK